jgi:hypothetical protein
MAALLSLPGYQTWCLIKMHLAIAMLVLAPLFVVLALVCRTTPRSLPFLRTALALVAAGTIFLYLAGGASALERRGDASFPLRAALQEHVALAKLTQTTFSGLTVILAAMVFAPRRRKDGTARPSPAALPLVYLLLYAAGIVILAHTACQGSRLSRELDTAASAPTPRHTVHVRTAPSN